MKKICIVVTSPFYIEVFVASQIRALSKLYEVTVIVNTQEVGLLQSLGIDAKLIQVRIERKIHPLNDIRALLELFRIFREREFDVVHSATPKAGLLAMVASFMALIPIRIHTFTGQVWVTKKGIMRLLIKLADKVTAFFASDILVDSSSQREFIVEEGVVPSSKASVLANGSVSGVDVNRFRPDPEFRAKIRKALRIPINSFVILYMSRLTRDKGAIMMAKIFAKYGVGSQGSHLLIVGPDEESLRPQMKEVCWHCSNQVHFVDQVHCPEEYMASADVFCLPSYREGFGTVLINAAAAGIPAIASRIYGSSDAVVDGVTGFLFEPGNISEGARLLEHLEAHPELRSSMGIRARARAIEKYSEELLTNSLLLFYENRLDMLPCARSP